MKKSVLIIGGGIAGLTVAHELAERGLRVVLLERNPEIGGMARSREEVNEQKVCPTEYSWRVFAGYYNNAFDLFPRIPLCRGNIGANARGNIGANARGNIGANVMDNLVALHTTKGYEVSLDNIPLKDKLTLFNLIFQGLLLSEEHRKDRWSNVSWRDYLLSKGISKHTYEMVVRSIGPYLGYDSYKASVYDMMKALDSIIPYSLKKYFGGNEKLYITNSTTNLSWFNPWERHLKENLGVDIRKNTLARRVILDSFGAISAVETSRGDILRADYYVFSASLESACQLLGSGEVAGRHPEFSSLPKLYRLGRQIQLSVQFYLDRRAWSGTVDGAKANTTVMYLPKAIWGIIIEPEGTVWGASGNDVIAQYCPAPIREIWSVGVCVAEVPGVLIKKPFIECTPEEIKREVWHQIMTEPGFPESIRTETRGNLAEVNVVDFKIWHSFSYNPATGRMDTWEPKFGNNVGTARLRPGATTAIPNMFFATAYCDTSIGIHSMEGAIEAGKRASNHILKAEGLPLAHIYEKRPIYPLLFGLPRFLDRLTYDSPAILIVFILIIFLLILWASSTFVIPKKMNHSPNNKT